MKSIAIAGKGGTGKTTISAMIIHWLSEYKTKSILAVDGDANVNLNDVLGITMNDTVGSIREEMKKKIQNIPNAMTKQQFLEYKIQSSLIETDNYDIIAMGRPEGPGCYCYSNNILRDILNTLSTNYHFMVIDNEAGMEHLSRRITNRIDYLIIISDPTVRGIKTAGKINQLVKELETEVEAVYLILNKVNNSIPKPIIDKVKTEGLELLGSIPLDSDLLNHDQQGKPLWPFISKSGAYQALGKIMQKLKME